MNKEELLNLKVERLHDAIAFFAKWRAGLVSKRDKSTDPSQVALYDAQIVVYDKVLDYLRAI